MCDEDCPEDHKCCVFDCGAVCVPPAFSTSHSVWPFLQWAVVTSLVKSSQRLNRLSESNLQSSSYIHWHVLILLSPQPSQGCVLAGAGAQGCVLNFALMTATAPPRRSAATMDVDISALHHTQVRYVAKIPHFSGITLVYMWSPKRMISLVWVCFCVWCVSETRPLRSAPGNPHVCRVLLPWWSVPRRAKVLQDHLRPRLQRALLIGHGTATHFFYFLQLHSSSLVKNVSTGLHKVWYFQGEC